MSACSSTRKLLLQVILLISSVADQESVSVKDQVRIMVYFTLSIPLRGPIFERFGSTAATTLN